MRARVGNPPSGKPSVARASALAVDPPRPSIWPWEDSRIGCIGGCDLGGKQTRGPERKGMTAASKTWPIQKSLYGIDANRRPGHIAGKAVALWEETGKCTTEGAGVGVQARGERIAELNVGKDPFPAGARSNLQGLSNQPKGEGGERIWVRHLSPYELRWPGNAGLGDGKHLPRRGNTPMGQRGSRSMTVLRRRHHARTCRAGISWQTERRAHCMVNSPARGACERALKLPRSEEGHMVLISNVIGRQPYPGNPAVRDENGGLRKRDHGSRIWVLRESWSEAAGLRKGSGRLHPNRPPDPERCARRISIQLEQPTGCDSYGVQVPCRQLPDSDGKYTRCVGR